MSNYNILKILHEEKGKHKQFPNKDRGEEVYFEDVNNIYKYKITHL